VLINETHNRTRVPVPPYSQTTHPAVPLSVHPTVFCLHVSIRAHVCAAARASARRCRAANGTTPYVSAYSTFAAMYYEFYILQTAPLSSTTRDPSRYSETRDKGRGVGVCARVKWKGKRRGFGIRDLLRTFDLAKQRALTLFSLAHILLTSVTEIRRRRFINCPSTFILIILHERANKPACQNVAPSWRGVSNRVFKYGNSCAESTSNKICEI